jgi:phosphatidate cytidylyltransferase
MNIPAPETLWLVGGVLGVLAVATVAGQILKRRLDTGLNPAIVGQFHLRIRTWWIICSVLALTFILGEVATVVLFGAISFWALREFITVTPTRRGDHRALFWTFFVITPGQYVLVGLDAHQWYSIAIPVAGFLFICIRVAIAGDYKRFLERIAKIQTGLMICVYCLSHAPALLTQTAYRSVPAAAPLPGGDSPMVDAPRQPLVLLAQASAAGSPTTATDVPDGSAGARPPAATPSNPRQLMGLEEKARLLFFFVLVVQIGDVMQYVWGNLVGRRVIAPEISESKTWEGFLGGVLTATVVGLLLWWATPFDPPTAAALAALVSAIGIAGGLAMSAVKRDRGVKDYGTLVAGHGGVLDRIDGICFAAPVFFYVTRPLLG